tara:strand:+ start:3160 stop:4125 length:966 start_codon:yes stop_codon:yes gene_type:complete
MSSFVAIDFETANEHRASACEIGVSVWNDGQLSSSQAVFVSPPAGLDYFDPFLTEQIHGITADMVEGSPQLDVFLDRMVTQIDGTPLVAHNAGFDMSVIRHFCDYVDIPYPEVDYFCTATLARKSFADDPNLVSFKLQNLISYLGIEWSQKHRAEDDAVMAGTLAQFLLDKHRAKDLFELAELLQVRPGRLGGDLDVRCTVRGTQRAPLTREELAQRAEALKQFGGISEWDPSGDFDGKYVKFTGSFSRPKADYEAALIECHGIPQKTVNKKTDFIVEGIQAADEASAGGSKSQRDAYRLRAEGSPIEVLDETEFLRLLTS